MSDHDMDFARRSVGYLRTQGLVTDEIVGALVTELDCPVNLAWQLAAGA